MESKKNHDINIQLQEINKGMHIENTLKDKTNSQQKTNELWIVTTIKAITKMPIQKFEMHILSFRRRHEAAVRNSKIFSELKGDLGAEIASKFFCVFSLIGSRCSRDTC